MSESGVNQNPIKKWSTALIGVLVVTAAVLWWQSRTPPAPIPAPMPAPMPVVTAGPAPEASSPAEQTTPEEAAKVEAEQAAAAEAAVRNVGQKPYTGPITERPDFVSDIEWQVLKGVAAQRADSDKELTRLVNHLRFVKQQEAWRSLATNGGDGAQRHALAEQLLNEIPDRVSNQEMAAPDAQKLQQMLIADLISDPQQRDQRAAKEFKRIVVPASTATPSAK
jgi:hypothetical protein